MRRIAARPVNVTTAVVSPLPVPGAIAILEFELFKLRSEVQETMVRLNFLQSRERLKDGQLNALRSHRRVFQSQAKALPLTTPLVATQESVQQQQQQQQQQQDETKAVRQSEEKQKERVPVPTATTTETQFDPLAVIVNGDQKSLLNASSPKASFVYVHNNGLEGYDAGPFLVVPSNTSSSSSACSSSSSSSTTIPVVMPAVDKQVEVSNIGTKQFIVDDSDYHGANKNLKRALKIILETWNKSITKHQTKPDINVFVRSLRKCRLSGDVVFLLKQGAHLHSCFTEILKILSKK